MNEKLKMFLSDVVKLNDLPSICANILAVFAIADTEIVEYDQELKLQLVKATGGMWGNSLQNKLKPLKDKGLLLNPNRKMYQLHESLKQATDALKQGEEVYIKVSYIETDTELRKQIAYVQDIQEETATESTINSEVTESTENPVVRHGRRGTPKPVDWEQIKAKILSGEITKNKYCRDNHISPNTLKKWLAEND